MFGKSLASLIGAALVVLSLVSPVSLGADQSSGWGTPTEIDTNEVGEAMWPEIAEDEDGNAISVWQQSDTICSSIWASRYVPGAGWADPVQISGDSIENAYEPDIDMDENGNAIAVWWQGTVYDSIIFSNRYVLGTGWGSPTEVNVGLSGFAGYPSVVCDSSGNAFAAWIQHPSIFSSRYLFGQGWGPPERVSANNFNAQPPSIDVDGVGNAVAVWSDKSSNTYSIWANRYVVGSGWGTQILIENDDTGECQAPRVAVDTAGNAIAVWHLFEPWVTDFDPVHVWANRYIAGIGWGDAVLLETNTANWAMNPRIAMDGAGNAIAVWYEISQSSWDGVWANMFSITTGMWSGAEWIPGTTGAEVDIDMNQAGLGIVVWYAATIYSNIYRPQTGWEKPEVVADIPDVGTQDPMVSINENGDAVAVWMVYEGRQGNVWANHYVAQETPHLDASALIEALINDIQDWGLPKGTTNGLTSKLFDAIKLIEKGNDNGALHKVMDFVSMVHALEGKQLTPAQADYALTSAEIIVDLLT
jgi:uncharacterized protein YuzE